MKSIVYYVKDINAVNMLRSFQALNVNLEGKVGVKVHSGEMGNQNFLGPSLMKDVIEYVAGTIIETNTAYEGSRDTTEKHLKTIKTHGWSDYFNVDILDQTGEIELPVRNANIISKNYVGANIVNYDSLLILSHFKGHPMGGFGGALKNISIGLASSYGKKYIHGAGDVIKFFDAPHDDFIASMADAAKSIMDYKKNKIAFINVMANMSVDCDCCKNAEKPEMKDIGILASLDPLALDQACVDLVYNSNDAGKTNLITRIESRHGTHILDCAEKLGIGNREYELIEI